MKKIIGLIFIGLFFVSCGSVFAQGRVVSGAEATGSFRSYFKGIYKGSYNEIKILPLGNGKLKIAFSLLYPHQDGTGDLTANTGEASGIAKIDGDTAVYESDEYGVCKITIKFVKLGLIKVSQEGGDCGFGFNVTADGNYKRASAKKPKFAEYK